jgi:amino acid transporter
MEAATSATKVKATPTEQPALKRSLGRNFLLLFVVGDIIGSGIYALVGKVAGAVGGAIWASFGVSMGLALLTAASYAELTTKYPHAAGAALYANKAFKRPFLTFMVAFSVMMSGVTSASTAAKAFSGDYLHELVAIPTGIAAFAFIILLGIINFRGITTSAIYNVVVTILSKFGLFVIFGLIGLTVLFGAGTDADFSRNLEFKADAVVPLAIFSGAALAFFSFIGFEDSANMAEEAKNPAESFPRALIGGVIIAGAVYLLVAIVSVAIVPPQQLADSSGPLLEVVKQGPVNIPPKLLSVMALLAVTNTALINMIMASRITYGMSRQGIIPRFFGAVHPHRRTPWIAIVFTSAIAFFLISMGDLTSLASTTVILLLLAFTIVNIAVLVLRKDRVSHKHFVVPKILPILAAITCPMLAIYRGAQEPKVFLFAICLLIIGVIFWFINYWYHGRIRRFDTQQLETFSA